MGKTLQVCGNPEENYQEGKPIHFLPLFMKKIPQCSLLLEEVHYSLKSGVSCEAHFTRISSSFSGKTSCL